MQCENRICYVVGAMSLSLSLRPCPAPGDYVIAADRGYDSLMAYGVNPDLVVGDFDSLGEVPNHPNVIQLPAEKDDTDMVFALRQGLDLGYRRFVMLGGVGGRLEHTLGNLQLLDWLAAALPTDAFLLSLMGQYTPPEMPLSDKHLNRRIATFEYESVRKHAVQLGLNGYGQERSSASAGYTPDFQTESL